MSITQTPLPYAFDALEPHLSRRTLAAHYGRLDYIAAFVGHLRATASKD